MNVPSVLSQNCFSLTFAGRWKDTEIVQNLFGRISFGLDWPEKIKKILLWATWGSEKVTISMWSTYYKVFSLRLNWRTCLEDSQEVSLSPNVRNCLVRSLNLTQNVEYLAYFKWALFIRFFTTSCCCSSMKISPTHDPQIKKGRQNWDAICILRVQGSRSF